MRHIIYFVVLVLLIGCRPIQPTPIVAPEPTKVSTVVTPEIVVTPPTEPTYQPTVTASVSERNSQASVRKKVLYDLQLTEDELKPSCTSWFDIDLERVYQRFDDPLFWTFYLNFEVVAKQWVIGCLRFYGKDNAASPPTYRLISNDILIPCTIHDVVIGSFTQSLETSAFHRGKPKQNVAAFYKPSDYIECPLDLGLEATQHLAEFVFYNFKEEDIKAIGDNAQRLYDKPEQSYAKEFSMAAYISSLESDYSDTPNIVYQPNLKIEPTPVIQQDYHLGFSFGQIFDPASVSALQLSFYAAEKYFPLDPEHKETFATLPQETNYFIGMDFGREPPKTDPPCGRYTLTFWSRTRSDDHPNIQRASVAPTDAIPFWSGPATITIGNGFVGKLNEVWVDPDSAVVPPTNIGD